MTGRYAGPWRPPLEIAHQRYGARELEVGTVVGYDYRAFEVTHAAPLLEPDDKGRTHRATLRRLHGDPMPHENAFRDSVFRYHPTYLWGTGGFTEYAGGRVYLCSCCGNPAPCRIQEAEETAAEAAKTFDERLARMGPGRCYGCGETITARQERITFPGEHADFPGRPAPTFHTRRACAGERWAYARRAGTHADGSPRDPGQQVQAHGEARQPELGD